MGTRPETVGASPPAAVPWQLPASEPLCQGPAPLPAAGPSPPGAAVPPIRLPAGLLAANHARPSFNQQLKTRQRQEASSELYASTCTVPDSAKNVTKLIEIDAIVKP